VASQQLELKAIAGSPDRFYQIKNIEFISDIADDIKTSICETPLSVTCCPKSGTSVELEATQPSVNILPGRYRFFAPDCSLGQHQVVIHVVSRSPSESCFVFASTETQLPSPLNSIASDTTDTAVKRIVVPAHASKPLFVSLRAPDDRTCNATVRFDADVSGLLSLASGTVALTPPVTTLPFLLGAGFVVVKGASFSPVSINGFMRFDELRASYSLEVRLLPPTASPSTGSASCLRSLPPPAHRAAEWPCGPTLRASRSGKLSTE
jgi:hypothetical protein